MTTLFKNGKIYDGSGKEPFVGDILVDDDKIIAVGDQIASDKAEQTVSLEGLSVAPGFIDAHSHNDWFAIKNDPLPYFEPFIRQGITTFVTGNCGLSTTGFEAGCDYVDKIGVGLFSYQNTTGKYGTAEEFFNAIDRKGPCNIALLAGHCSARAAVSGYANRRLTADEEKQMLSILEKELIQGAAGISLGLMYEPGLYADIEELKKVAQICLKYDRPLTVHPRANSKVSMAYPQLLGRSHLLRALDELVEIARGTKLKLQYSHAIFVGRRSFGNKNEFVRIINELRAQGIDAKFDIYNETLGVSVITVILPAWYQSMSPEEKRNPLNKFKLNLLVKASSILLGFGFKDIQIAYIGKGYEQYEGKTVHQIAKEIGKSDLETYLELCEKSRFHGRVNMGPYSTREIIKDFEHNENCLYMTDAWVEDFGVQNPAIYDCFPKFLKDSLTGFGDTMPQTVRRMSGAVADRFMLPERGYIKEGFFADLTVFDENELKSAETDRQRSFGIRKVVINGHIVLDDDKIDDNSLKTSGRAVRVGGQK